MGKQLDTNWDATSFRELYKASGYKCTFLVAKLNEKGHKTIHTSTFSYFLNGIRIPKANTYACVLELLGADEDTIREEVQKVIKARNNL